MTTLDGELLLDIMQANAGAALALESEQPGRQAILGVTSYPGKGLLLEDVKSKVSEGESNAGRQPRVLSSVLWRDAAEGQSTFVSR